MASKPAVDREIPRPNAGFLGLTAAISGGVPAIAAVFRANLRQSFDEVCLLWPVSEKGRDRPHACGSPAAESRDRVRNATGAVCSDRLGEVG